MELGEKLKKINRVSLALALGIGGLALAADSPTNTEARHARPTTEAAVARQPKASQAAATNPNRQLPATPGSESTAKTPTSDVSPASEYPAITTTTRPEAPSPIEIRSRKIRDRVARSLPIKGLAVLKVPSDVRSQFPDSLIVNAKGCAAVIDLTPIKGQKIEARIELYARPHVMTSAQALYDNAYTDKVGHVDTGYRPATGRSPVAIVEPDTHSVQVAVGALAEPACNEMAK